VQVGFGGKNHRAGTRSAVAAFCGGVVESAMTAEFAGAGIGNKIVGWAKNLEVVQVVERGSADVLAPKESRVTSGGKCRERAPGRVKNRQGTRAWRPVRTVNRGRAQPS
jgi:hypothetical protein